VYKGQPGTLAADAYAATVTSERHRHRYEFANDYREPLAASGPILSGASPDKRLVEMGLDPKAYWWYRDLRRYGTVPHAGFGLGFERTVIYATGLGNIRDAIPYPRTPGNAEF